MKDLAVLSAGWVFVVFFFLDERTFSPLCAAAALGAEHTNLAFLEHIKVPILSRTRFLRAARIPQGRCACEAQFEYGL